MNCLRNYILNRAIKKHREYWLNTYIDFKRLGLLDRSSFDEDGYMNNVLNAELRCINRLEMLKR